MGRNILSLGGRSLAGKYGRVLVLGEVEAADSSINRLRVLGHTHIRRSHIKKLRVLGEADGRDCEFGAARIFGQADLKGVCKAGRFTVSGGLSAEYLECDKLQNCDEKTNKWKKNSDNSCEWGGYFKARTFVNKHKLDIGFDFDFEKIISVAQLRSEKEIPCESFYGFCRVTAKGVNAGLILIVPYAGTEIDSLAGGEITVCRAYAPDRKLRAEVGFKRRNKIESDGSIVRVSQIEGDRVSVESVNSDLISGDDVTIGDLCIVKRVEYRKSLRISEKAVVGETVKI